MTLGRFLALCALLAVCLAGSAGAMDGMEMGELLEGGRRHRPTVPA